MRGRDLVLGVVIVLPVVVLAALRIEAVRDLLTDSAIARRESAAKLVGLLIRERFQRIVEVNISLATRVAFRQEIEAGQWAAAIRRLEGVPKDYPDIDRILLADPSGVLRADIPNRPEVHGTDFSQRDWYRGVSREWKPYVSEMYTRLAAPQRQVVAVAGPIRSNDGRVLGVLVLQVAIERLLDWRQAVGDEGLGSIFFVDRNGQAVGRPAATPPASEPLQRLRRGERGCVVAGDRLIAFEPVPDFGWGVVIEQSTSEAFVRRSRAFRVSLATTVPLVILNVIVAVALVRTLRRRRRAETVLAEKARELERSNRDLEEFASVASHDLQEPLRKIQAFSDLLKEDAGETLNEPSRDHLARMRRAAARMRTMIDDVLSLARVTTRGQPFVPVDLNAVAREVVGDLEGRLHETGGRVEFQGLPTVEADPTQIRQLLQNLVGNGLKFHRAGEAPVVRISAVEEGGVIRLSVADNGIGFDEKYLPRLFKPFERLHSRSEYEGTGIGLAVCRKIAERHGGGITARSSPGQGSTFVVTLPRRKESMP